MQSHYRLTRAVVDQCVKMLSFAPLICFIKFFIKFLIITGTFDCESPWSSLVEKDETVCVEKGIYFT